jgi:hypothetical protein
MQLHSGQPCNVRSTAAAPHPGPAATWAVEHCKACQPLDLSNLEGCRRAHWRRAGPHVILRRGACWAAPAPAARSSCALHQAPLRPHTVPSWQTHAAGGGLVRITRRMHGDGRWPAAGRCFPLKRTNSHNHSTGSGIVETAEPCSWGPGGAGQVPGPLNAWSSWRRRQEAAGAARAACGWAKHTGCTAVPRRCKRAACVLWLPTGRAAAACCMRTPGARDARWATGRAPSKQFSACTRATLPYQVVLRRAPLGVLLGIYERSWFCSPHGRWAAALLRPQKRMHTHRFTFQPLEARGPAARRQRRRHAAALRPSCAPGDPAAPAARGWNASCPCPTLQVAT